MSDRKKTDNEENPRPPKFRRFICSLAGSMTYLCTEAFLQVFISHYYASFAALFHEMFH